MVYGHLEIFFKYFLQIMGAMHLRASGKAVPRTFRARTPFSLLSGFCEARVWVDPFASPRVQWKSRKSKKKKNSRTSSSSKASSSAVVSGNTSIAFRQERRQPEKRCSHHHHQQQRDLKPAAEFIDSKRMESTATDDSDGSSDEYYDQNSFPISELKEYKKWHGTINVPKRCPHAPNLALWVERCRRNRVGLTQSQLSKLEGLGFIWKDAHFVKLDQQWEDMLEQLKTYKKKHGDCLVPLKNYDTGPDRELGIWVKNQRAQKQRRLLSRERQQRLDSIGFVWVAQVKNPKTFENLWNERYQQLLDFKERHGHTRVPKSYPCNTKLGDWVHNQRMAYARGKLRDDRIEKLDEIDFCWRPKPKSKVAVQL